jgi:hypothetical protein
VPCCLRVSSLSPGYRPRKVPSASQFTAVTSVLEIHIRTHTQEPRRRTLDLSGFGARDIDVDRDSLSSQAGYGGPAAPNPQTPTAFAGASRESSYIVPTHTPSSPTYASPRGYYSGPASATNYGIYDVPHFTTPASPQPSDFRSSAGSFYPASNTRRQPQAFEAFAPQLSPRLHDPPSPNGSEGAEQSTQL